MQSGALRAAWPVGEERAKLRQVLTAHAPGGRGLATFRQRGRRPGSGRRGAAPLKPARYWQMLLAGASGTLSFHFNGVTPGSGVSASQIRSDMHLCPESFGYTPIPDVV